MSKYETLIKKIKGSYDVTISEDQIVSTLHRLPPRQQSLVRANFINGGHKRRIANELGLSLYRVSLELRKAIRTLKFELNPEWRQKLADIACRATAR